MDSERKHELQTNDLKEFLDNFKDFWDKHGNKLLLILIIGLGSYAGYNYYNTWKTGKLEDAQIALEETTAPDMLVQNVADEHDRARDEAMRRAGDLYLAQARSATVKDNDKDLKSALDKAGAAYTALSTEAKSTEYQLSGYEGLAYVAIEAKAWDKAKEHFKKMQELAGDSFPAQAARAKAGPQIIDLVKNQTAFAPEDDLSFNPDDEPDPTDSDKPKDDSTAPGN